MSIYTVIIHSVRKTRSGRTASLAATETVLGFHVGRGVVPANLGHSTCFDIAGSFSLHNINICIYKLITNF